MANSREGRSLPWAACLLGFSLGGFFDGILLHQVLQWHHLLSDVQAAAWQDMRMQVLADGLFHLLMYLVATAGLALLWRSRFDFARPGADRTLGAWALLGFGGWHVVDAVVSHWLTGIHRVRGDATNPLFWDLLWLAVFGLLPLALGWITLRKGAGGGQAGPAAGALGLAVLVAGPLAALPGAGPADQVVVLFRPGVSAAAAFDALAGVDARVLWVDASGGLWAVRLDDPRKARQLYAGGALLLSDSPLALGCLSFTRSPRT